MVVECCNGTAIAEGICHENVITVMLIFIFFCPREENPLILGLGKCRGKDTVPIWSYVPYPPRGWPVALHPYPTSEFEPD